MILVTGASGLLGRALVDSLSNKGFAVRAQVRSAGRCLYDRKDGSKFHSELMNAGAADGVQLSFPAVVLSTARVEYVEADFLRATAVSYAELVAGCDVIVHAAGLVHAPDAPSHMFNQLNTNATGQLIEAGKEAGVKTFVFLSTSAIYGSSFQDADEYAPAQPLTPYAVSKLACENLLRESEAAERVIVLRPSLIFGEGDRGNMLNLIRQISRGRYVNISGNTACKSVIYAADAALAVSLCLERLNDGHHILNLANPDVVKVNDLSREISSNLGRQPSLSVPLPILKVGACLAETVLRRRSPLTVDRLQKLTTSTTLNVQQLVQVTGFRPQVSLSQALASEINWARKESLI